jgi:O-antigen ligase
LATFLSCLLQSQFRPLPDKFVAPRVLFVYVVPIVFAGALGSRHVGDIPAYLSLLGDMRYDSAGGYFRDVAVKPLFLVLYSVLIGVAVHRSASPKKFFAPLLISIWVMSLMVVGFFLATGADFGVLASERARNFLSPLGMHANDLGRLYATAYALLLFTWARSTAVELKVVLLASMGLVFVALLLTFSRGAFFSFIAVNLLYLYWSRRLKTMLVGGLLGAVVILAMPGAISYRLTSGIGQGANAVTAGRVDEIWMPLLPELLRSPIYGNGLSSILWSDAMQTQSILAVAHPHNAYLGVLLDMGFAGLVAMAIFYWYLWRGFRTLAFDQTLEPAQRGFFEGAAAGLLSFLIAGMAGSSLTPAPEQVYLWLSAGAMFGIMSRKRQTQSARDEPATLKKYPAARVRHGFA